MSKNKLMNRSTGWWLVLILGFTQSAFAKSIKQALNDTAQEGVNIGDAFLIVVIVGCGFGIAWSKTRMAVLKHLPFVALGAYLIYNAPSVVSWFRGFLS